MRAFGRLLLVSAVFFSAFGSPATAAPPSGSYRDSCTAVRTSGGSLRARCEQRHGRRVWTRLERYKTCVGDISNYQGQLVCLRRHDLPGGSWSDRCRNPHLAAPGVFGADCRSPSGGRIASRIPLTACPGGLTTADGHLTCDKPPSRSVENVQLERPQMPPSPPPAAEGEELSSPSSDQPLPPGSYQETCRNLDFDGQFLGGECRDRSGAWQETSLDARRCARDQEISNDNGELVCARSGQEREPPRGSYRQSCRQTVFDGRFLSGECRDARGAWDKATLDIRPCHEGEDIANDDGELVCRRAAAVSAPDEQRGAAHDDAGPRTGQTSNDQGQ